MWYITRHYLFRFFHSWGPVFAAMLVMFVASAQPKIDPPANLPSTAIYFSGPLPVFPGLWDVLIKKSAHVVAFGMLGLLTLRALLIWHFKLKEASHLAITLATSYGMLDELHQAFVYGRHASGLDVGIDFVGVVLFVLVACRLYAHHKPSSDSLKATRP